MPDQEWHIMIAARAGLNVLENKKQHEICIFINSMDISALYFLTG